VGHHHPKAFIAAIQQRERHYSLTESRVEQIWAKIEGNQIDCLDKPVAGSQSITLITLFEDPL
jgi:hypothetical protein